MMYGEFIKDKVHRGSSMRDQGGIIEMKAGESVTFKPCNPQVDPYFVTEGT